MKVLWKNEADPQRLRTLADQERDARQRDRYRVVLLAGSGDENGRELYRDAIAGRVGRSRQFVDEWVGRYRTGGIDALAPIRNKGIPCKLNAAQLEQLQALLDRGPLPEEGLAAYSGSILRRKIEEHFGKLYALSSVYALLHRLGYNDLMPRPRHPEADPARQEAFKKRTAPADRRNHSGSSGQTPVDLVSG